MNHASFDKVHELKNRGRILLKAVVQLLPWHFTLLIRSIDTGLPTFCKVGSYQTQYDLELISSLQKTETLSV